MKNRLGTLVVLCALSLVAACGRGEAPVTAPPTQAPQPVNTPAPTAALDTSTMVPAPDCPPAGGIGTIAPAISVYSVTFVVNGVEQVVRAGDALQAAPGDSLTVSKVAICTGPFSGNGGEACVDIVPVDRNGRELLSDHGGTHMVRVTSGVISIPGPSYAWTVDENWEHLLAVVNHWTPGDTQDLDCADGRCERDDLVIIRLDGNGSR